MSDHDDVSEVSCFSLKQMKKVLVFICIQIVEIDFEVGHSSIIRSETTTHNPPRTHDWKVFLRSSDVNGDLSCLIHRCIFHLHPEFLNNKRGRNIYIFHYKNNIFRIKNNTICYSRNWLCWFSFSNTNYLFYFLFKYILFLAN